ncbi:conserved exported hypothetical protein [Luteimonas sp. 9C]|uniref:hypothetical protein n=1 Tax=Luteimonas sp. 9C TaxID=2653148 RepID=UPI0012F2E709|nr:hypothetical protein [Luteimonas sp. 9C]VXA92238.1 conserved exported hypothetical protein [Luteimonas sp. 9C]
MPWSRSTLSRAPLTACLLLALGACGEPPAPAGATEMPAPALDASTPRAAEVPGGAAPPPTGLDGAAVRAFLVRQYGDLAQLSGDWPGAPLVEWLGHETALREVCAREAVGTPDAPAELLAVCGVPDDAGHATTARLDFFRLQADAGADVVNATARAHMEGFGSTGDIADLDVRRLGPRLYGFVVEDGFTAQGITITNTSLVLPDGDGFKVAGSLRSSLDNLGAMAGCAERDDCAQDAAYDLTFDLALDARDADAVAWPLRVRERGDACGRRVERTHLVPFDVARHAWTVPEALQRDGCD